MSLPRLCDHTDDESYWLNDGRGIPLARVCDRCVERVKLRYNPVILRWYTQADVDEQIEPDDW